MRTIQKLVCLMLSLLLCLACVPSLAEAAPMVVNIARGGDTTTMDPIFAGDNVDIWLMNLVFEGLVRSTADGKSIEPCLATSWDISDDGKTYTFHLREGVCFSDGTPVKAEDWEYSIERSLAEGAWNSLIASISDVQVVDDATVAIVLSNPSGSLLANLAAFFCAVVPKDYYSSTDADTLASKPIGTGPFYLESWVPQESMCFKKNPNYWDAGHPMADEINFLCVPDDNTRVMQLQAGQVDVVTDISVQMESMLQGAAGISIKDYESTHVEYISMNFTSEKLNDTRVRQALTYATNRDDLIKAVYGGMGTRCTSFVWPAAPHYNPNLPTYEYDLEKAKALLAEAGASDLELSLIITAGSPTDLMEATILKSQWAEAGVTLNIEQLDSSARREKRNDLTFEVLLNYFTSDICDTSENMEMFCINENYDCWHLGWNGPRQEEAERLVKEAGATNDESVRMKNYCDAQQIFAEEALIIPVCCVPSTVAMRDNVEGFVQTPLGNYMFNELRIAQ
ncbi:MAG: ABC transporter substrate-binding protein [Eubacteriales bacterium]|nr:ABC transporter substrate-binding protein [Eubacteriales bacterium]